MVYGDGAFKDPVGKIWELADPIVSPGYTKGLDDFFGIIQNGFWVVGEDDFGFCTFFLDKIFIVIHIVHTGEGMSGFSEQLLKLYLCRWKRLQ